MCCSMNMKVELLLSLVALCIELSIGVKKTQMCLKWNVTGNHLFLKCNVLSVEDDIRLIDAFDQSRVRCSKNRTTHCDSYSKEDIIFENFSDNGFSLVFKTGKKNENGEWKCIHGNHEERINITVSTGTVHSTDMYLFGDITEMKENNNFKLTCFSCWTPVPKSVYFFVNDMLEDIVRYSDGKCYHKRKLCSPTECSCSTEGNNFTWHFISDLTYVKFSCEMRFKDEETLDLSFQRSHLLYNKTGFTHELKSEIRTILVSDKDIYFSSGNQDVKNIESGFQANLYTVSLTVLWIIAIGCIVHFISTEKDRIKNWVLRCYKGIKCSSASEMKVEAFCFECDEAPGCAICIDCRKCYCNDCCEKHIKKDPHHRLCQTPHVRTSFAKILCGNCTKIAARFCKICSELRCLSCFHFHEEKHMLRIFPVPVVSKTRNSKNGKPLLKHIKNVPIESDECTVRINGIGYLQDGSLVALDGSNHELIVFIHNQTPIEEQKPFKEAFKDEPCAMTTMVENKIAVTFSYAKRITIYDIMLNETNILNVQQDIFTEQLGVPKCKPFSIAYHQGCFALEVGEGEDGKIIIFDHSGITIQSLKIISYKFAYFTGHTIRLALDTNQGILVVSAMGKRMVSCMDYSKGDYLWKISKASPRSMLIHEKNIILSSRRCNAIYQLDKKSGKEIVLAKEIPSPRYIAYNSYASELCIHVKNSDDKDELAFYDFKVPDESNTMSKLLDHEGQCAS